ncbi:MAG: tetratricopeptide repeat protein [Flavobacteriales bacterium]
MRTLLVLMLVLVLGHAACGQSRRDSLIAQLPNAKDALQRLHLLSSICSLSDPDGRYSLATIHLADSLIMHGHAHDTTVLVSKGDALWQFGYYRFDPGPDRNEDSAFHYYKRASEAYAASGDERCIAFAASNIARFYIDRGDAREALRLVRSALPVHEKWHNAAMLIKDHGNLARAYYALGDLERSIDQQQLALRYAEEKHAVSDGAAILHNIGTIYKDEGQLDTASAYFSRAIAAFKSGNDAPDRCIM